MSNRRDKEDYAIRHNDDSTGMQIIVKLTKEEINTIYNQRRDEILYKQASEMLCECFDFKVQRRLLSVVNEMNEISDFSEVKKEAIFDFERDKDKLEAFRSKYGYELAGKDGDFSTLAKSVLRHSVERFKEREWELCSCDRQLVYQSFWKSCIMQILENKDAEGNEITSEPVDHERNFALLIEAMGYKLIQEKKDINGENRVVYTLVDCGTDKIAGAILYTADDVLDAMSEIHLKGAFYDELRDSYKYNFPDRKLESYECTNLWLSIAAQYKCGDEDEREFYEENRSDFEILDTMYNHSSEVDIAAVYDIMTVKSEEYTSEEKGECI